MIFIAFAAPSRLRSSLYTQLPVRVSKRSRSLRTAHTVSRRLRPPTVASHTPNHQDLLDLYTIDTPPNPLVAAQTATNALHSLPKYLINSPIPSHTLAAFNTALAWRNRPNARPYLCIDSGCGCAQSTLRLARQFPNYDVIGIDRSEPRLMRNAAFRNHNGCPPNYPNVLLLRADLVPFWRLCARHLMLPHRHYILYPNPYPRPTDIKRRWYGHPIFPVLAKLSGRLEIRASWSAYLDDWRAAHLALARLGLTTMYARSLPSVDSPQPLLDLHPDSEDPYLAPLSNFEAKYLRVGQPIYSLVIGQDVDT